MNVFHSVRVGLLNGWVRRCPRIWLYYSFTRRIHQANWFLGVILANPKLEAANNQCSWICCLQKWLRTKIRSDMYIEKGDSSESVKYWTEWKSEKKLHQLLSDADLFLHTTTIAWSLLELLSELTRPAYQERISQSQSFALSDSMAWCCQSLVPEWQSLTFA